MLCCRAAHYADQRGVGVNHRAEADPLLPAHVDHGEPADADARQPSEDFEFEAVLRPCGGIRKEF